MSKSNQFLHFNTLMVIDMFVFYIYKHLSEGNYIQYCGVQEQFLFAHNLL